MDRYRDAAIPEAKVGKWASRYEQRNSQRKDIWHGRLSPEEIRRSRQGYYGCVSHIDDQVGRIFEALEKRGWLDETLILFTSDHRDMTGDQNLWRKSYAYESSAHVPMTMRWPSGMMDYEAWKRGVAARGNARRAAHLPRSRGGWVVPPHRRPESAFVGAQER
jgi:arylsulfatase A-like enzyme